MELAAAIEENVLDFFVLKPKSNKNVEAKHIFGQCYRVREKKIYIEIFQQSIKMIRKAHKNELYDISFVLNRMPFQLQHYALDFVENEQLFNKLINNSYYKCKSMQLTQANGVPTQRSHPYQYVTFFLQKLKITQTYCKFV